MPWKDPEVARDRRNEARRLRREDEAYRRKEQARDEAARAFKNNPPPVDGKDSTVERLSAIDTMALTVWGEARGEGLTGMAAVAWVIKNRADRGGWWGSDIKSVCLKPWQFSCWNAADPNRQRLLELASFINSGSTRQIASSGGSELPVIKDLCERVLTGETPNPIGAATHYHTKRVRPSWISSHKMSYLRDIGSHKFYLEK